MNMLTWLILAYLGVGFIVLFRPVVRNMGLITDLDWCDDGETWMFLIMGTVLGVIVTALAAAFWPLYIGFRVLTTFAPIGPQDLSRKLAGESNSDKIARLEGEARERERKIARLEREAGLT